MIIDRRRFFTWFAGLSAFVATSPAFAIEIQTDFKRAVNLIRRTVGRLAREGHDGETFSRADLRACCEQLSNPAKSVPALRHVTMHCYACVLRASDELTEMGIDEVTIRKANAHVTKDHLLAA